MAGRTLHAPATGDAAPPPRRHDLVDRQLLEEIELLFEVMSRVAEHSGDLSTHDVDSVLGLTKTAHGAVRVSEDVDAFALHAATDAVDGSPALLV